MSTDSTETASGATGDDATQKRRLLRAVQGSISDRPWEMLLLVNLLFLFARPQFEIPILRTLYVPLILSLPLAAYWLLHFRESLTPQTKAMIALLIFGMIWIPLARNNRWAFNFAIAEFLRTFACYIFPLVVLGSTPRMLRRIFRLFLWIGAYLALYSLNVWKILSNGLIGLGTESGLGSGPGAFLGDENDFALMLTVLLCFPLLILGTARSAREKFFMFSVAALLIAGIVATMSRGGFIGLVCALGYIFLKSESKLGLSLTFGVLALGAAILAPVSYWDEVRSITNTNEGTALQRRQIWSVAKDIWLDPARPSHFFFGVGMGNAKYWLLDYEPAVNFSAEGRSIAGRAIHSLYLEMLPDTGLFGLIIFLTVVISSYRGNSRIIRRSKRLTSELRQNLPSAVPTSVLGEVRWVAAFANALNACWPAILTSGAFISIFYYPTIWFIAGLSGAVQLCYARLERTLQIVSASSMDTQKGHGG